MPRHLLPLLSLVFSFALPISAEGVGLGELSSDAAAKVVESEWRSLNKATGVESDFMGKQSRPDWGETLSLPFPTAWPPQSDMGFAYYVFGSYYTPMRHGPTVYQSAPWAKVVLRRDGAQQKTLLRTSIGPAIEARGSRPLTGEQGAQYSSIQALGNASMQFLFAWKELPEEGNWPAADVRRLYCQWSLDNRTLYEGYIKNNHLEFDKWLSCDRFEQQNGIVFDSRDNHRVATNTADANDHEKLASRFSPDAPDDGHSFNQLSGIKAGLRGSVFGTGEGIASAIGVALQASRIESVKDEPSGRLAERRVYSKDGLTVVVTVLPGDGAILPNMVEAATPAAIRMVSKSLSEMNRAALIANLGPPDVEGASIVRYRGPMELCEESVDFRFEEQALVSVLWQFCGGR